MATGCALANQIVKQSKQTFVGNDCLLLVYTRSNMAACRCLWRLLPNPNPPTSTHHLRRKHAWTCDVPLRAERRPALRVYPITCALILPLLPIPSSAPPCHTFFSPVPPQSSSVLPPPTSSVFNPLPSCFVSTPSPSYNLFVNCMREPFARTWFSLTGNSRAGQAPRAHLR